MKLLFAILAAVLLAGCTIHYPPDMYNLGPPTRDPGRIVEVTYNSFDQVQEACEAIFGVKRPWLIILGCAEVYTGVCVIHYKHGDLVTRHHELAHCTHGLWHN